MTDKSVDAAASTSNKRKKLTDEERKERQREYNKRYWEKNKEELNAKRRVANMSPKQIEHRKELYRQPRIQARIQSYRAENKERLYAASKAWREKNKEKCAAAAKKYRSENKEKIELQRRKWRKENKETIREKAREKNKEYWQKNKLIETKRMRRYMRDRKQTDPSFKLACRLRNRLYCCLRGSQKVGSAVQDLGCTGQEACDHLASLFDEHMTWNNWGTYWDVDHIYPLAKANLEDRVEFLAVNNWRNLQPLESGENNRKGDTVTPEAQKLFDDLKTQFLKEDAA